MSQQSVEIYRAYQANGPRYTSYPSANHFHNGFGAADWAAAARHSNEVPIPAPLSLYVHVPYCTSPCFFCACNRVITRDPEVGDRYATLLRQEIRLQGEMFDRDREVIQVHFGGGTPTNIGCAGIASVMHELVSNFHMADGQTREFGIEIDPRVTDKDMLVFLRGQGFDRLSMGVQDFDPAVQQAINRIQPAEHTLALLDTARSLGFRAINVDLICGLPRQTTAGLEATLAQVLAHRPDRIALYGYAHMPSLFKAQKQIAVEDLPALAEKLALMRLADNLLVQAGYEMIGLDHYALPDDPLAVALHDGTLQRNFQGYSTHAQADLVGLGVSAIGMIDDCYAQNARNIEGYTAALAAQALPVVRGFRLSDDDLLRREIIHTLMCAGSVCFADVEHGYGIDFSDYFADELRALGQLADDGLVEVDAQGFRLSPSGRPVMRVVAMLFDAYLPHAPGTHSTAI